MGLLSLLVPPTLLTKQTTGTNPIAKVSTSLSLSVVCCVYIKPTNLPQKKRRPGSLTVTRPKGVEEHCVTWDARDPLHPATHNNHFRSRSQKGNAHGHPVFLCPSFFPPPKHPQKQRQKHRQHTEEGTRQTELPHPDLPRRHPLNLLKLKPKGLQEVFFLRVLFLLPGIAFFFLRAFFFFFLMVFVSLLLL